MSIFLQLAFMAVAMFLALPTMAQEEQIVTLSGNAYITSGGNAAIDEGRCAIRNWDDAETVISFYFRTTESGNMDIALDEQTCVTGEVGLGGEMRPVNRIDQRIKEAEKLGFKQIIVPAGQKYDAHNLKIKVLEVSRVAEAFKILLHK